LICEWVLLVGGIGLALCTCCVLMGAGFGCIAAWTMPGGGGGAGAGPPGGGGGGEKKVVASFIHGDTYTPGVLSARANMDQFQQGVGSYTGVNGLRTGGSLPHLGQVGAADLDAGIWSQEGFVPGRVYSAGAVLHGDDAKSIKPRFDPGMGR
jgi:hypothetical protein